MTTPHSAANLPTRDNPSGTCPNPACGTYVRFEHRFPWNPTRIWPQVSEGGLARTAGSLCFDVWHCPACEQTTVVFERRNDRTDDDVEAPGELLLAWPRRAPREMDAAVPEEIRSLFAEGSEAEHAGALRAAAAMYRATVEALCTERGAAGKNLYNDIEGLKTKGVSDDIVDHLHEARILGNWSLHKGTEFTAEEVADVADLIYEALFEVYVQPAQRAAMREARRNRRTAHRAGETEPS